MDQDYANYFSYDYFAIYRHIYLLGLI